MPTDLTVVMRDQPGELARLGEVAMSAGVHLRGLAAFTGDGRGFVHVLVDDECVSKAKQALAREGIGVADAREVLVVETDHRPGGLVDVMVALAEADVNVDLVYTVGGGKVAIATDDLNKARDALS
ncbi:MAG TPA: hypothetical protein VFZ00_25710 [Solirubrobacter sp.]|nr:hypothetical protein [Solirubrobacter sp.]